MWCMCTCMYSVQVTLDLIILRQGQSLNKPGAELAAGKPQ